MGLPLTAPMENYLTPEGPSIAPIVVVYEHQFLAHQVQFTERYGKPDHDRVLLYPGTRLQPKPELTVLQTEPELIALTDDGDRLGRLLITDPQLRRRALELGYRVLDFTGLNSSDQLATFLTEHGLPVPIVPARSTRTVLPELPLLETMIPVVGNCPSSR